MKNTLKELLPQTPGRRRRLKTEKDNKFKIVEGNIWLSIEKNRRTQKQLNPKTF